MSRDLIQMLRNALQGKETGGYIKGIYTKSTGLQVYQRSMSAGSFRTRRCYA